jgi:hypothetical protein
MAPSRAHGRREITDAVDLCDADGRLADAAVGWSREPLHRSNLRGRGRTKRWEYWCVQTPEVVVALTVSDLDYAALCSIWALDTRDPARPRESGATRLLPLRRVPMPDRCGDTPVRVEHGDFAIDLSPTDTGVHLSARSPEVSADVQVTRPPGHECLAVVVPWNPRRFQYTVKQNTLPATGEVRIGGVTLPVEGPDAWATLDHGRGRWPYRITWNWGSGSGRVRHAGRERVLGLQVGGAWTDGTGSTENAVTVDGRAHPVLEDLVWQYDRHDWTAPWRVRARSGALDLQLRPSYERRDRTQLGVLFNDTHQCFGTWHGTVVVDGDEVSVDGVRGWAEQVRNRW